MFPELVPLFQDAFDKAKDGAVYCIEQHRGNEINLRTQLGRIIKQAGLKAWPKLFQNLRSTRETELFKLTNGNVKAVCAWIGNTPQVALNHYAQVTEADLNEAAKMTVLNNAENQIQKEPENNQNERVLNQEHSIAEDDGNVRKEDLEESNLTPCGCDSLPQFSEPCLTVQKDPEWAIEDSNL
ncbi:MAG: hypothetical protein ABFD79_04155 [Phycisphaerales bacterium]